MDSERLEHLKLQVTHCNGIDQAQRERWFIIKQNDTIIRLLKEVTDARQQEQK